MVTNQTVDYKFSWGDAVKVISDAPEQYLKVQMVS